MKKGIHYTLEPINSTDTHRWRVGRDVRIIRAYRGTCVPSSGWILVSCLEV